MKPILVLIACSIVALYCKTTDSTIKDTKIPKKEIMVSKTHDDQSIDEEEAGCIEGDCINGKGIFLYPDGSKYKGQFKNSKMHGNGSFIWGKKSVWTGSKFVGEFKYDMINGKGTWTWGDGGKYIGECKNNQMHGEGIMYYPDGRVKKGKWGKDKYIGE